MLEMDENIKHIKLSYEDPNTEEIIEHSILYDLEPVIEINEDPKLKIDLKESSDINLEVSLLSGVFKCFECIFTCSTTLDLAIHYKAHRLNSPFKCFKCGYDGKSKADFLEHSISHIESNYFQCSKCTYKTSTIKAIKSHVFVKHDKQKVVCSICSTKFSTESAKLQHEMQCSKQAMSSDNEEMDTEDGNNVSQKNKENSNLKKETENVNSRKNYKIDISDESDSKMMFTCPTCYFIFPSKIGLCHHDFNTHLKNWKIRKQNKQSSQFSSVKKQKTKEIAESKNPYVNLERLYLCPYCYIIFASEQDFNEHNASHSIVTDCNTCGSKFLTNDELKVHINEEHPQCPMFSCINCGNFFTKELDLQLHLKLVHNTKGIFTCPLCPRLIKTEQGLKLHLEAHSKVKTLKCSECQYMAINPSDLRKHSQKHAEPKYLCPNNCGAAYKKLELLTNHMRNCNEDEEDEDIYDNEEEEIDNEYVAEIKQERDETGDENHDEDSFEEKPQIEIDISQKDRLVCSECKTSFKEPSQLKEHLLVHFHNNPFRCQKCGLRCSSQLSLDEHISSHLEESPVIKCSLCRKICSTNLKLIKHMASHSIDRPFQCPHCPLAFKTKSTLKKHICIHNEEKPFACPECNFASKRKDGLKKHMLKHSKHSNGLI